MKMMHKPTLKRERAIRYNKDKFDISRRTAEEDIDITMNHLKSGVEVCYCGCKLPE